MMWLNDSHSKEGWLINTNYRGTTLTSIGAKLFSRMVLNRIRPFVDPILRWNQNGFRQQRSTISQILALRRIIEGMKTKNLPLAVVFIDYSKAFDSIHRERMFQILHAYGIPAVIIDAIKAIYTDSSALVISTDGDTEPFEILAGVLQGDTLAPFLFIVVVDYIMRHALKDTNHSTGIVIERRKRDVTLNCAFTIWTSLMTLHCYLHPLSELKSCYSILKKPQTVLNYFIGSYRGKPLTVFYYNLLL